MIFLKLTGGAGSLFGSRCSITPKTVNARNTGARAMYRRHGYREVGIVPTVFNGIPDVQLVLLEKQIILNKQEA